MSNKKDMTVYELLDAAVKAEPFREVIYDLTNRKTYEQLLHDVDKIAEQLANLGIAKGDRVGVSLPNWYETVVLLFAIAKIGAIVVPFNVSYKLHELEHILTNSEPKLVFVSENLIKNTPIDAILRYVDQVVTVRFQEKTLPTFESFLKQDINIKTEQNEIKVDDDIYCILYTSGTTGVPKGVMMTHRCVVQSAVTISEGLKCRKDDVFIVSAPLFHIFGMVCNIFAAVVNQSKIVLQEKFNAGETLRLIEQEKVTIHQGVPTMFIKELNHPDFDKYDLSTLRTGMVGAAPCPPEVIRDIRGKMGLNLLISLGITETGTVTLTKYDEEEKNILETVGKAIDGAEVKIVDDERNTLPPGEIGEIAVRGFGVMKGYYKMPEQTAEVLDSDGWYYSGDLGVLDENGYLRFIGRKKEMIIRGGYNIYPQELEGVLSEYPKVYESAVIGLPDEVLGEIVCAVIKLKDGVTATEEEIIEYMKKEVAIYKVPSKVLFTEEFPTTSSGKIQKVKLKEMIAKQLNN